MLKLTYGCRGGVDFFFVNAADSHTYPCGYRGNEDHGWLWDMDIRRTGPRAETDICRRCDWECFRDPSELFGPLLEIFSNPLGPARRMAAAPQALSTWTGDLCYYQACGFFNGRQPADYKKLKRFSFKAAGAGGRKSPSLEKTDFNQKLSVS